MSFLRKGMFYSGGQLLGVILTFFMNILYSRVLGVDGVGQWRLFDTVTMIGGTLATMGISVAAVYFINNLKRPVTQIATVGLYYCMISGAVAAVAVFFLIWLLPGYFGRLPLPVIALFSLSLAVFPTSVLLFQVMIAEMNVTRLVLAQLSKTVVVIGVGLVFAAMHRLSVEKAIVIGVVGTMLAAAQVVYYERKHIDFSIPFDWPLFRQMLTYGVKLASAGVLLLASTEVSIVLLRTLMPGQFAPVGLYTRATTICGLAVILPRLLAPLLYAKWSGVSGEARTHQVEMALRVGVLYSLAVAAVLMLGGKYIIWLMYGRAFIPAVVPLRLLAPATVFASIFLIAHNAILGDGRGGLLNWLLGGTVLVIFPSIWLLAPRMGIAGAAVGTLLGNVFLGVATLVACRRLFGVRIKHCLWPRSEDIVSAWRSIRRGRSEGQAEAVLNGAPGQESVES